VLAWSITLTMVSIAGCSSDDADGGLASTTVVATTTTPDEAPSSSAPATVSDADEPVPTEPAPPSATDGTAEDGSAAPDGPEPRWMSADSEELFDQDVMHTFEIDLPEDALAELDENPAAEEYVEGTLTLGGETVEPIGIRYKGSVGAFLGCTAGPDPFAPSGPKACTKLSMQLKINWDDPSREFYGVRTVQLHSQNLDATMMHERLGYWLFREMGVPAPRSTHARVVVNGEYAGVFALTEEIDGRFTREHFEDGTGNLYKEVWPINTEGRTTATGVLIGGLETNEDENPTADIITAFADEVIAAAPEDRVAVIERWSDVDLLLRTFVVDRGIKNDDGALHWYCFGACGPHNYYWYEDPSAEQVYFIPWDIDNAFENLSAASAVGQFTQIADAWGETRNDCRPFPFGSFGLLQRSAACDPILGALGSLDAEFDRIRAEFVAGPFAEERVTALLDEWTAQIEPAVAEAAAAHDDAPSVASWRAAVEQLEAGLAAGRAGNGR
jgi:hypothetical protein